MRRVEPLTRQFVAAIEEFVRDHGIPLVSFDKGQRQEDVAAAYRADFSAPEEVVFVGKAQEKCTVYRTEKRRNPHTDSGLGSTAVRGGVGRADSGDPVAGRTRSSGI
jgi:hypothetical protein